MRVLVTGGTGYIGHAVVRALQDAGHQVSVLTRQQDPAVPGGVTAVTGDLFSPATRDAIATTDAVCHLAALAQARESAADPAGYYRVNVTGTLDLLAALLEHDQDDPARLPRLVFASTSAVYGTPAEQPIGEDTPLNPMNPYGATKAAAEQAIAWHAATGRLGATTLRIFNAAGGLDGRADHDLTRIIPKTVAVAAGNAPAVSVNGDGSAVRDFVHIADIADAFVRALEHTQPGKVATYNVGGVPASVAEIIATTERVTGRAVTVEHRPANPHEAPALYADTSRLQDDLGWRPTRSNLDRIISDQWAAEQRR
jgi:UDP-glucose 4-epimerase